MQGQGKGKGLPQGIGKLPVSYRHKCLVVYNTTTVILNFRYLKVNFLGPENLHRDILSLRSQ